MTLDPRAAFILGHAIERAGRTWTTWEVDAEEPTDPAIPASPPTTDGGGAMVTGEGR